MSDSFSAFDTRQFNRRSYGLLGDFSRVDDVFGKITVKQGFITNFASIDLFHNFFLFIFWALLATYGDKSATIHDWLYTGYGIEKDDGTVYYPTRKECDQIFLRTLRAEGVARWRAYAFYWGVRIGGKSSFYTGKAYYESPAWI